MALKFGFEKEYFIKRKGDFVLSPKSLPHDDCGFLAEARGLPNECPVKAAFLMLADEHVLFQSFRKEGLKLVETSLEVLTKEFEREALRQFGKPAMAPELGNIYGIDYPADEERVARAGLHVHFSNERDSFNSKGESTGKVAGLLNMPKLIQLLDQAFAGEIKDSQRLPGFYEMKHYGFEYRSLPATIDPVDVAEVLKNRKGAKDY